MTQWGDGPPRRAIIIVADGAGCGGAPDAAEYGDAGADTLGNLARAVGGLALPDWQALGLGNLTAIAGVPPAAAARGAWGAMREASAGKDTITGHWEMAGLRHRRQAMATFPSGFPREITAPLQTAAGRGLLGNKPASGTAIIDELGPQHIATSGDLILYTSRGLGAADRRARGGRAADRALPDLRSGARDRRPPPDRPRHRAAVRRDAGRVQAHLQPARLSR